MYFGQGYFKAVFWEADYFGRVGVGAPVAPFDPYAWFPGDPGPQPPTKPGRVRRNAELTEEEEEKRRKRKRRHRHPLRIPAALLEAVEFPPPLEVPALAEPVPIPELAPFTPINPEDVRSPIDQVVAPLAMAPPPEPQGAHWTEYQHIPYAMEEENEELQAILAAVLRRG